MSVSQPLWIGIDEVVELHAVQLARFGGATGLRDRGALEGALDRPRNKWAYESAGPLALGAAYAYGLSKAQAFVDGNKRISFLAMATFLIANHVAFTADPGEATAMMLGIASSDVDEAVLEAWLTSCCKLPPD